MASAEALWQGRAVRVQEVCEKASRLTVMREERRENEAPNHLQHLWPFAGHDKESEFYSNRNGKTFGGF